MSATLDPKRVIADGYDTMGREFGAWNAERSPDARRWFLGEILARLPEGSDVLEVGCGPGTDAAALSTGRRYIGIDLSNVQLSLARQLVPRATFVVGDFTTMDFRPESFDGIVAFYVFNHVPEQELVPTFERIFAWLRPGGRLMTSLLTTEAEDRVEEWLGIPMFFAGIKPESNDRLLREIGFAIEVSERRDEFDPLYGKGETRWVIAKKPAASVSAS
jgi:cyclopropane fatty-acyl-phospholipid synthase-like methyltransferase